MTPKRHYEINGPLFSNLSFFRPWPPGRWRTWRWPPGRWWAWPPRLVGQIWSTNPYWLPCNCGKSIKPRELAGNISNFCYFDMIFFCLTKMTLIQVLYSKDDISRSLPDHTNKQTNKRGPTNWSVRGNSCQDIKKIFKNTTFIMSFKSEIFLIKTNIFLK